MMWRGEVRCSRGTEVPDGCGLLHYFIHRVRFCIFSLDSRESRVDRVKYVMYVQARIAHQKAASGRHATDA